VSSPTSEAEDEPNNSPGSVKDRIRKLEAATEGSLKEKHGALHGII
jgi:hypothetical protein